MGFPLFCSSSYSLHTNEDGLVTPYSSAFRRFTWRFSSRRSQLMARRARSLQTIIISMTTERSAKPPNERVMCILDFDETITERDSSEWVAEQLGYANLFKDLRDDGMAWHDAMNYVLGLSHSTGTSISAIQNALWNIPLHPNIVPTLKLAHERGCELRILSDANTFFIDTVLQHHGIRGIFTGVHSNPAWIDNKGQLQYTALANANYAKHARPSVSANNNSYNENFLPMMMMPPHSCPHCPPNLCKGAVLDAILSLRLNHPFSHADNARLKVVYVGDGSGDYCPSLRLRAHDVALPRKGYPLDKLLYHNFPIVAAQVQPWTSLSLALHHSILAL